MLQCGSVVSAFYGTGTELAMNIPLAQIENDVQTLTLELLHEAKLSPGEIMVLGCSSSEICGKRIGKGSNAEVGAAVIRAILPILDERGLHLAVQCCEHLNRAIVIAKDVANKYHLQPVSVIPVITAGGSCAMAAHNALPHAIVVEHVTAHAGIDIGDTSIGMHVAHVQVPVRPEIRQIGHAHVSCLRSRPKFIGGERAVYF